jgi:hypothetical protein
VLRLLRLGNRECTSLPESSALILIVTENADSGTHQVMSLDAAITDDYPGAGTHLPIAAEATTMLRLCVLLVTPSPLSLTEADVESLNVGGIKLKK